MFIRLFIVFLEPNKFTDSTLKEQKMDSNQLVRKIERSEKVLEAQKKQLAETIKKAGSWPACVSVLALARSNIQKHKVDMESML